MRRPAVAVGRLLDGVTDLDGMATAATAAVAVHAFNQTRLDAACDRSPAERSGLLGVLADAIDSGVRIRGEARQILVQLFSAGTETTSSLIATAIELLARQPDLQERLRREPARIPQALEDVLRAVSSSAATRVSP